ncbi:hypothetical protein BZL29_7762 [Mycobacterium kansasii]|uniref:Uncharacterized protein n=1 Tax=Mycobacterium kansasii TaxID=1768 RepID=A0A1V3WGL8_MYCKA|nr:hypothetical protein BZL29_7762 [Mycobacterium kansasii]
MEGAFIDAARALVDGRLTTLQNRIEGYRYLAKRALWASSEIHSTKADMVEIVNKAEEDIQAARDAAEKAKQAAAAVPGAAEAIEGQLQANIASIVAGAAGLAQARDAEGAGNVALLVADVASGPCRTATRHCPNPAASALPPLPRQLHPRLMAVGLRCNRSITKD